jgi:hypothetical protein
LQWQNSAYVCQIDDLAARLNFSEGTREAEIRKLKVQLYASNIAVESARREQEAAWNSMQSLSSIYQRILTSSSIELGEAELQRSLVDSIAECHKKKAENYSLKHMIGRLKRFRTIEMEEEEEAAIISVPPNTPGSSDDLGSRLGSPSNA